MNLIEKQLESRYIYKGKIINVRKDTAELPDGNTALREVVEHPGGVCVAAITDAGELLTVRQYRYPYARIITEIPAGKRNNAHEDPLECGKRELREETGAVADEYIFLGELYPTPGYCGEIIYMYAARRLKFVGAQPDSDEFLNAEKIPFEKAVQMVMSGEIKDAKTQAAVLKLKYLKDNGEF